MIFSAPLFPAISSVPTMTSRDTSPELSSPLAEMLTLFERFLSFLGSDAVVDDMRAKPEVCRRLFVEVCRILT
jgi:hypothetical protein